MPRPQLYARPCRCCHRSKPPQPPQARSLLQEVAWRTAAWAMVPASPHERRSSPQLSHRSSRTHAPARSGGAPDGADGMADGMVDAPAAAASSVIAPTGPARRRGPAAPAIWADGMRPLQQLARVKRAARFPHMPARDRVGAGPDAPRPCAIAVVGAASARAKRRGGGRRPAGGLGGGDRQVPEAVRWRPSAQPAAAAGRRGGAARAALSGLC